jgi:hypothetical protein
MTHEHYKIEVSWGRRPESPEACAERLAEMLSRLAEIHPTLVRWYKKAMSRAAANRPFCTMPPQRKELARALVKGRYFTDQPREPMPDLGYSVSAWNGHDDDRAAGLNVHTGAYGVHRSEPNDVVLSFAPPGADADLFETLLLAIALPWQADWGVVRTFDYMCHVQELGPSPRPSSGWMTYLPARLAERIEPAHGAIVRPVPTGGIVLQSTREPFTTSNPVHVAAADAIFASFEPIRVP